MIILTDFAKEKIKKLLSTKEGENFSLRISTLGGGCSGISFDMNLAIPTPEDEVIMLGDNHRVIIDPISYQYVDGVTVDYIETIQGSGFSFSHPKKHSCGCGKSMSIS